MDTLMLSKVYRMERQMARAEQRQLTECDENEMMNREAAFSFFWINIDKAIMSQKLKEFMGIKIINKI